MSSPELAVPAFLSCPRYGRLVSSARFFGGCSFQMGGLMAHVVVSSIQDLQQEIQTGKHRFFADEPVEAGGNDTGPDPYSLLLSALGA